MIVGGTEPEPAAGAGDCPGPLRPLRPRAVPRRLGQVQLAAYLLDGERGEVGDESRLLARFVSGALRAVASERGSVLAARPGGRYDGHGRSIADRRKGLDNVRPSAILRPMNDPGQKETTMYQHLRHAPRSYTIPLFVQARVDDGASLGLAIFDAALYFCLRPSQVERAIERWV